MALERQAIVFAADNQEHSLLIAHFSEELTESGTEVQSFVIPLIARRKGMMLALPIGLLKHTVLAAAGPIDEEALVGPSRSFEVDLLLEDEATGIPYSAGFKSEVMVVDFSNDVLPFLREYDPVTDSTEEVVGFHDLYPQALPAAEELLNLVLSWAEGDTASRTYFYSARDEPVPKKAVGPKKAPAKRTTTSALAEQLTQLSAQVALIAAQQQQIAEKAPPAQTGVPGGVSSATPAAVPGTLVPSGPVPKMPPVSAGLMTPAANRPAAKTLQLLGPPPRTRASPLGSGPTPQPFDEPYDPVRAPPDTQEQILSQQTMALNALVSHLVQGGDALGLH